MRAILFLFLALNGTFEAVHAAKPLSSFEDQFDEQLRRNHGLVSSAVGLAEKFCQKYLKPDSPLTASVMKVLGESRGIDEKLEGTDLLQHGQISELLESGPIFGRLPSGTTHSNYDVVAYALAKIVRLFLASFVFKVLFVIPRHKMAVYDALNESRERAANIHRICTHMREHVEHPSYAHCEAGTLPRDLCIAAEIAWMDSEEWLMCQTRPDELGLIEGDLDHGLERCLTAVDPLAPVLFPLTIEYFGSANSVMGISQTACMDRDERLINKIPFLIYFQIYGPTPRCPEDNGKQTGFAEYKNGFKSVEYKCFAEYELKGLTVRDINHLDSNTDGLEGDMPTCVPKPAAPGAPPPAPVEKFPVPIGGLRNGAMESAPIILVVIIFLQVYMYHSNQVASRREMRSDLRKYELNQMYTPRGAFEPGHGRTAQVDKKSHGKEGVPRTLGLYSFGHPYHEGGSATRFHVKRRALSDKTKDLINNDLAIQTFFLAFNAYSTLMAFVVLPAFLARDVGRLEKITPFVL